MTVAWKRWRPDILGQGRGRKTREEATAPVQMQGTAPPCSGSRLAPAASPPVGGPPPLPGTQQVRHPVGAGLHPCCPSFHWIYSTSTQSHPWMSSPKNKQQKPEKKRSLVCIHPATGPDSRKVTRGPLAGSSGIETTGSRGGCKASGLKELAAHSGDQAQNKVDPPSAINRKFKNWVLGVFMEQFESQEGHLGSIFYLKDPRWGGSMVFNPSPVTEAWALSIVSITSNMTICTLFMIVLP